GGFVCNRGAVTKRLVVTHLKAPFEFRLLGMQEENKSDFFCDFFKSKKT
ncbi:MAG: hypothetical protein ACI8QG_000741, partial [Flavobacteriales bacterium]